MDEKSCNWSEKRYKEIKGEVDKMLTKIGYKTKKIPFIPMSGFLGVNLTDKGNAIRDEKMKWYKGWNCTIKKKKLSEMTYKEIKGEVDKMLTKIGYKTKKIPFIPMSGFNGDNLNEPSKNMPWYKGFEVKIKKEKVKGHTL